MNHKAEHRCVSCKQALTWEQRGYNEGVCPLCGHRSPHAHTIVDTEVHTYTEAKQRTGRPWWQIWKPAFKAIRIYKQ